MTNVFFDSKIYSMNPERLKFFRTLIRSSSIDVMRDQDMVEYSIDTDDGTTFAFSCVYTTDNIGRPGRYYAITVDMQVLCDGFCLDGQKPTEITKNLMALVKQCSDKILAQEIHARQNGILAQINNEKTYS